MEALKLLETEPRIRVPVEKVRANTYQTREIRELKINDVKESWHSVKGGVLPEHIDTLDPVRASGVTFEILHEPESSRWLKIVPPEASHYKTLAERLRFSAAIMRRSLVISGLPDQAERVKDCLVDVRGRKVYGFISPHLGPSVEFLLKSISGKKRPTDVPKEFKEVISLLYKRAFSHAADLYLGNGYWVSDPNPGNIILFGGNIDEMEVVLIDFSNKSQRRDHVLNKIPEVYRLTREQLRIKALRDLGDSFDHTCKSLNIPFFNPQEIGSFIETKLGQHPLPYVVHQGPLI